jgi:hypothetical protein
LGDVPVRRPGLKPFRLRVDEPGEAPTGGASRCSTPMLLRSCSYWWDRPTGQRPKHNRWGITMRKLFILVALGFALVTAATATVVATTLYAQASIADAG